jgi:hypothetical protein
MSPPILPKILPAIFGDVGTWVEVLKPELSDPIVKLPLKFQDVAFVSSLFANAKSTVFLDKLRRWNDVKICA